MEGDISEFSYFLQLFWPFFTGALCVRVICWVFGNFSWWIGKSFGD